MGWRIFRQVQDALYWLKRLDKAAFFTALAPALPIGASLPDGVQHPAPSRLGPAGFALIPGVLEVAPAKLLFNAIEALAAQNLPPVFAYVYDALWEPLAALQPIARAELGDYDVLADGWAFRILPGRRGWHPHRGIHTYEGGRTTLNVWIALTDVTGETSCMHVVPLDRDPAYPHDLASVEVPRDATVPLEMATGTAAVWDANVLHWGGEMSASAPGPRMSFTFTLRARDARRTDLPAPIPDRLDFRARLDLIAAQLLAYAHMESVDPSLLAWARLTCGTLAAANRLR